uniref:PDZ domain-containing protein n=1 Tax=Cyclopterus lumpus TaxID=8103 RepID=A0A8C2WYS3_CYCLU
APFTNGFLLLFFVFLQQVDQDSYQNGEGDSDMSLCLPAIQKLMEYIKFNFMEGDTAPPGSPSSCREGLDVEVHAVSLSKDEADAAEFGLSFGNIPIFGDPDGRKKGGPRRRRDQGPIMDVGCIWVTEVRKRSPAAHCGGIKLRDELLSLNGQLMVGVDVSGASYLADQCWNGGCIYLIMLRRVKRKAPLPPCNANGSIGTAVVADRCEDPPQYGAAPEPSDRSTNGKRTRKFGVISRSSSNRDNRDGGGTSELKSSYHGCNGSSVSTDAEVLFQHSFEQGSYIWKMHLVKGDEGLGIQITGGRGSKRSPHGIIIAHVEKAGAIHRYGETN